MTPIEPDELYRRYSPIVLRRARQLVGEDDAEEVMHEIFVEVLEQKSAFRGASSPATWLYRVTTNHCLNRLRDHHRRRELLDRATRDELLFPGRMDDAEARVTLTERWEQLTDELAAIALYYHVDGMSQAAIGDVMNLSARTVGNRLAALRALPSKPGTGETTP